MTILRYILLGFSALATLAVLVFWTVSGRASDIALFILLAFLIANTFYVFASRPSLKTSDLLARVSTSLALASLELQHQAQEAQGREVETEKRRLAETEHHQYKLQVAKDMLQHLRAKLPQDRKDQANLPQITHQARSDTGALPLPPPAPPAPETVRPPNGRDAAEKPTQPAPPVSPAPAAALVG